MRRLILVACILVPGTLFARPRTSPLGMAEVKRVLVVVLDSAGTQAALQQPFLASLAAGGALLRNYHAVADASQPNRIALVAGNTYGVTNDTPVMLDVRHLGDLLDATKIDWKVYADDYPGGCFLGDFAADGDDGWYLRANVPFLQFTDLQTTASCSHIVSGWTFDPASLPQFAMYFPDTIDDGHDLGIPAADAFLQSRFARLLSDPELLVIIVSANGGFCVMTGAGIRPGSISDVWYDHYSLLRTIETIFRTGTLHQMDDAATIIADVWKR